MKIPKEQPFDLDSSEALVRAAQPESATATSAADAKDAVGFPRTPTEAMLNAARDWSVKKYGIGVGNDDATGCWQVMYDAAMAAAPSNPNNIDKKEIK